MMLCLTLKGCCDYGNSENIASSRSVKRVALSQYLFWKNQHKNPLQQTFKQGCNTAHTYITLCGC